MIDLASRARLRASQGNNMMMEATKNAIKEGFAAKGPEDTLKMVFEKKDDQQVVTLLEKIGNALPIMVKSFPKSVILPKIFQVRGTVAVTNAISVNNLTTLEKKMDDLGTKFSLGMASLAQAISSVSNQKIEFPKLEIPKAEKIDFTSVIEAIQNQDKPSKDDSTPVLRDIKKVMQAIADKPTMTTQPVTNINVNALQGFSKTTSVTVGTTLTKLPSYGVLNNRRTMILFNNSSTVTVYVGGSDVTTTNGMPILAQSYSPAIDAGVYMIIYGVTSSSTADVRVMEVSSNQTASIVQ